LLDLGGALGFQAEARQALLDLAQLQPAAQGQGDCRTREGEDQGDLGVQLRPEEGDEGDRDGDGQADQ